MADTDEPQVETRMEGAVMVATLNRPRVRNAVGDRMRGELIALLERINREDGVRALVLTGAGSAFCAGGDIAAMRERLDAPAGQVAFNGWRRQGQVHRAVALLHALGKPVIAAVNGAAAGLGCDLAFACDFVIASTAASFTMSYILRGLIPDGGGLYFLPRRVGVTRAKELVYSGRTVAAPEAQAIGLADRLAEPDRLIADAVTWAGELSGGSTTALALAKSILDQSLEKSAEEIFALGSQAQAICYTSDEHRAAVTAFFKR